DRPFAMGAYMKCACPTTAGKRYRWSMTVQSPSGTADEFGHTDLTDDANWITAGNIKANFITKGTKEGRVFDQVQAEVTHIIETRSTSLSRSIHPVDRIVFGERKFNVNGSYDTDQERQAEQVMLTEVV